MKPVPGVSPLDEKTRFRVQIKHAAAIGPGKADVLQSIAETGSLAETGRRMGMSYQRVWSLVAAMNVDFVDPLVFKQRGGVAGGGARLTPTGEQVLSIYRAIECDAQGAVARRLPQLLKFIRAEARQPEMPESSSAVSDSPRKVARATAITPPAGTTTPRAPPPAPRTPRRRRRRAR